MKCSQADKLIIKYCENTLTEKERKELFEHISVCNKCMESFNLCVDSYEVISDIDELNVIDKPFTDISIPDNFTSNLMRKIDIIDFKDKIKLNKKDRIKNSLIVVLSTVSALITLLIVHKNAIERFLYKTYYLKINLLTSLLDKTVYSSQGFFNDALSLFNENAVLIKALIAAIVFLFVIMHKFLFEKSVYQGGR